VSKSLFKTVSIMRTGYDRDEVDEFFDHAKAAYEGLIPETVTAADIQQATFALVRRGYDSYEVDAALDRLEAAFVSKARTDFVAAHGQAAWMAGLAERARTLYGRLSRPSGEKFDSREGRKQGYSKAAVDTLCNRLVGFFDRQEPIGSADVRGTIFPPARGRDAYAEGPVDAFFARAIEVLLGVE